MSRTTGAAAPLFTPTAEQRAIADAVARLRPGQLLKVQARAGTGKTSTLEYLAYNDARQMLYLAYNADIAAAAKKRFPDTVTVKTTHGLAWSALGIHEWIPEKGAPRNIRSWEIERWLKRRNSDPRLKTGASLADVAADVLATARAFLHSADPELTVAHAWGRQRRTQREAFLDSARQDNRDNADLASRDGHARYARYQAWLVAQAEALWQAMIDRRHADLPLEHDAYLKLYQLSRPQLDWEVILLDEAQDSNPCALSLFLDQPGAKVMVGDEAQAIYGFRGAKDALQTPGAELPLLESFRFGPAIAEAANRILAFKADYWRGFHRLRGFPEQESRLGEVTHPPYTVICRSNQGVFLEAFKAVSAGLKINSGAKDLEDSIRYVESAWALMSGERIASRHPEIAEFPGWDVLVQESHSDAALQWLVKLVEDHREDMPTVCERLRAAKTRMKKQADVLLVTAHKAKGLEFSQVILADDFKALDSALEQAIKAGTEQALAELPDQELHLLYVAATRAKHRLQPNRTMHLMDQLDTLLARIRADHAQTAPESERPAAAPPAPPPADLSGMSAPEARARFAAFHPLLQTAMKAAARHYRWCPETWAMQVEMVADFLEREGYWIGAIRALAARYQAPPPDGYFAEDAEREAA
jgi:superfamily I DNA/RNA helicase